MEKSAGSREVRKRGNCGVGKSVSWKIRKAGRKIRRKIGVENTGGGRPRRPYI